MKKIQSGVLWLAFILLGVTTGKAQHRSEPIPTGNLVEYVQASKEYDEESKTTYYLTRIKHKDKAGNIIKLYTEYAINPQGDVALDFAKRKNSSVAFNASMGMRNLPPNVRQPKGIQIIDGVIKQEQQTGYYVLGIKDDNLLVAYPPSMTAVEVLKDGTKTALTGFIPLIEDHEIVSEELFKIAGHLGRHPRQVIAQFDNKDILILSTGGRGIDGEGMTAYDLSRILKKLNVRFALNLDGGGSVSTVIGDQSITKKIDKKGTEYRPRPNFLYVKIDEAKKVAR